jgi:heptosyltransferase-3
VTDRILIIRAGALGDVVLTLPAIHGLRQRYLGAHLTVAGYPALWSLAGPLVDDIIAIDSARFATLFTSSPAPDLQTWLTTFDLIIAWTTRDPSPALAVIHTAMLHASPYPPPGIHAADWLCQTITLPSDRPTFDRALENWTHRTNLMPHPTPNRTIIHPGAGAPWKCWPPAHFAALAVALEDRGHHIELIAGPADDEAIAATLHHANRPFPLIREPTPLQLAHHLSTASLYIGSDSGVTHLAAAAGVPTLALFGPTDPTSWAPLRRTRILRACSAPARHQGQIRVCDDPACLDALSVEEVLSAVVG